MAVDCGMGQRQRGQRWLAGTHYHDAARKEEVVDATKLLSGCVAWYSLHHLPPYRHQAFSTRTAMFGLETLAVPALQVKTLLQKCHFPEDPSKVCTQGVRCWSHGAVDRGEASWTREPGGRA